VLTFASTIGSENLYSLSQFLFRGWWLATALGTNFEIVCSWRFSDERRCQHTIWYVKFLSDIYVFVDMIKCDISCIEKTIVVLKFNIISFATILFYQILNISFLAFFRNMLPFLLNYFLIVNKYILCTHDALGPLFKEMFLFICHFQVLRLHYLMRNLANYRN
jgi:hypothetical protein